MFNKIHTNVFPPGKSFLAIFLLVWFGLTALPFNLKAQCPTGNVIYVRSNAAANGNGQSWATAYNTLQAAINAGTTCTTQKQIWVAKGTYYPTEKPWNANSSDNRDMAFYLRNNLAIYGGFDGTETSLSNRNTTTNPTVLSGDIGTAGNNSDNCYHVMVNVFNNTTTVLNGFTITSGNASGSGTLSFTIGTNNYALARSNGGGIYNLANAQPMLVNLAIVKNKATDFGGGMYSINANPVITNAVFYADSANYGGGMLNENSNPGITNATFYSNYAASNGGAMRNYNAAPTIRNTIIWDNKGGGMQSIYSSNGSDTTRVWNCIVQGTTVYNGAANNNTNTSPKWLNEAMPAGADDDWMTMDDGLRLSCGSPAINTATTEGGHAANDILGITRPQGSAYDKGAYEYVVMAPAVSIIANTGFPACPGTPVTFTATGSDVGVSPIYQWYVNNIAVGSNSSSFTYPALAGGDVVYLRLNNGCATGTSNTITVSFLAPPSRKIYVDKSVATPGNGSSWSTAFRELGNALPAAMRCNTVDSILIAKGTYKPTAGTNKDSTFLITRGKLKIYGGYPSGGGTRNPVLNPTILTGDLGEPSDHTDADHSFHVMVASGIINTSDSLVVDGFTFSYSNYSMEGTSIYNGVAIPYRGALAIVANDTNMVVAVRNCSFFADYNGAMYNKQSRLSISDCRFTNYSPVINDSCSLVMNRCFFSGNQEVSSFTAPGVMHNYASLLQLNECSFINNFSVALYNEKCTGSFNKCRFDSNGTNSNLWAGVHNRLSNMVYTDCIISNSLSRTNAGGMFNIDSTTVLTNCIFYSNKSFDPNSRGAIRSSRGKTTITNCTFFGNEGGDGGGSITSGEVAGSISFANCILWGNTNNTVMFSNDTYNSIKATFSIVQGGYTGTGNTNMYPVFTDSASRNLDLQTGSPAINAGNNDSIPSGITTDIRGNLRVQNGRVDMGAYEYNFILPIKLISFIGYRKVGANELQWKASTTSATTFTVQRGMNGRDFESLGIVNAPANTSDKTFTLTDNNLHAAKYYYRLQIKEAGGQISYSNIVMLISNKDGVEITSFYPSPLTGNTGYLNIISEKAGRLQVVVTDIVGHQLSTQPIHIIAGSNKIPLTFGELAAGTYLLQVKEDKNGSNTIRFIKN